MFTAVSWYEDPTNEVSRYEVNWTLEQIPDLAASMQTMQPSYEVTGVDYFDEAGQLVHRQDPIRSGNLYASQSADYAAAADRRDAREGEQRTKTSLVLVVVIVVIVLIVVLAR